MMTTFRKRSANDLVLAERWHTQHVVEHLRVDVPRQQRFEVLDGRGLWQLGKDELQIRIRIQPVRSCCHDKCVEIRAGHRALLRVREKPVIAPYGKRPDRVLDQVVVDAQAPVQTVGRKNWLFSDTQKGAVASANLYTLVETARANGLNPYAYLKLVFTELPKATTVEHFEALLPWNVVPKALDDMLRVPAFSKDQVVR